MWGQQKRPGAGRTGGGGGGGGGGTVGKRALTDGLRAPPMLRRLGAEADDGQIKRTIEYRDLVDPANVWKWGMKITEAEALLACRLMLGAMRGGELVDWRLEAKRYVIEARRQLGAPPAAAPVADVAQGELAAPPEGEVCAPAEGEVCEDDGPREPRWEDIHDDDDGAPTAIRDPGLPPWADKFRRFVDEARDLAKHLEEQGEEDEAGHARALGAAISSGLVSLAIIGGVYLIAVNVGEGTVITATWATTEAGAAELLRRQGRAASVIAELESHLLDLEKVKARVEPRWVEERAGMGDKARAYQDGAEGARYIVETRASEVPALDYLDDEGKPRTCRFDAYDGDVLIDRKTAVMARPRILDEAQRQSRALAANGRRGVWEVPTKDEARNAQRIFDRLGITNISPRIVSR